MARGGTTQTLSFEQALNVTGSGATGIDLAGGSSAVAVTLADALTVQGGVNGATGIFLGDGTTQVLDLAGPVNIQSRSEEHTSELQSLMRISYAVFCLKKKNKKQN